jgi:hypothetical protein
MSPELPRGRVPAPWWEPVRRGDDVIGVLVDLAPTGQVVVGWPSRTEGQPANLLALGDLGDLADVRIDGPVMARVEPPILFGLSRRFDPSRVSGTGLVAVGAELRPLGTVALAWIGQTTGHQTVSRYPSIEAVRRIHGHDGATELVAMPAALVGQAAPVPLAAGQAAR